MAKKEVILGVLTMVILLTSIYIFIPDKVKLSIEPTVSKFYVWEDSKWVLSGEEYVYLYDGSKKMSANSRIVNYSNTSSMIYITRTAKWKDNITTIDTYTFDSTIDDVELFPISHILECFNCKGKIVQFEYRKLLYDGITREAFSPESFGHNMKVEWQDGAYYAKVFQQLTSDKLIIKYRPLTNYENYNVRLFDPTEGCAVDTRDRPTFVNGTIKTDNGLLLIGEHVVPTNASSWLPYNAYNNTEWYQNMTARGINTVRLLNYKQPVSSCTTTPGLCESKELSAIHIREALNKLTPLGMYAIIDYHSIDGDLRDASVYNNVSEFWTYIAPLFANDTNVIFELVNEPDINNETRIDVESLYNLTRALAPDTPIILWSLAQLTSTTGYNNISSWAPQNNTVVAFHDYWSSSMASMQNLRAAGYNVFMTERQQNTSTNACGYDNTFPTATYQQLIDCTDATYYKYYRTYNVSFVSLKAYPLYPTHTNYLLDVNISYLAVDDMGGICNVSEESGSSILLNMSLSASLQEADYVGSARGIVVDNSGLIAYVASVTDSISKLNVTDKTNITTIGRLNISDPPGSLDQIRHMTVDLDRGICHGSSYVDDEYSVVNCTPDIPVSLWSTGNRSDGTNSTDGIWQAQYYQGNDYFGISFASVDDTVVVWNLTNPAAGIYVSNYVSSAIPCSMDNLRYVHKINNSNVFIVSAINDYSVSAIAISETGTISCLNGTGSDSSSPYSLEEPESFYYDDNLNILFGLSRTDKELSIYNFTTTIASSLPAVAIGNATLKSFPISVTGATVGNDKFVFIGYNTSEQGIDVYNVTNPSLPTYYQNFNTTDGSCVYNQVYSMDVVDNYLYAVSSADTCIYTIKLFDYSCTTPTGNLVISSDTTLCSGTYYLNGTGYNGGLMINNSDNIVLDCAGATIYGDPYRNWSAGINVKGNNITIKNCNIKLFQTAIFGSNYDISPTEFEWNLTIYNNTITQISGVGGIFTDGVKSLFIYNNVFANFTDYWSGEIGSHAIYSSGYNENQTTINGSIYNNLIQNMSASGVKFNSQGTSANVLIYNNTFKNFEQTRGDDIGVHLADTENISIFGNLFIDSGPGNIDAGIVLNQGYVGYVQNKPARNNKIYNNNFSSIITAVWAKRDAYNNSIYNNTYTSLNLEYRFNETVNDTHFYESGTFRIGDGWNDFWLLFNFSGNKNFTISNTTVTFNNNIYPYDDVVNVSSGVVVSYDVRSGDILVLSDNEYYTIQDVGGCDEPSEDMIITADTTLCSGTYYLNDSNTNGVILMRANTVLTCDGTILLGNNISSSTGIRGEYTSTQNYTITGCNVASYATCVGAYSYNHEVYNNTMTHCTYGILSNYVGSGNLFENNTIVGKTSGTDYGVYFEKVNGTIVRYNNISDVSFGVDMPSSFAHSSIIAYNNITNVDTSGIRVNVLSNGSQVYGNRINTSSWNCLDMEGTNGIYYDNIIDSCTHNALDICGITTAVDRSNNNSIYNNLVYNSNLLYACYGFNNSIYNNILYGANTDNDGTGQIIAIEFNSSFGGGNRIYNNTIYNFNSTTAIGDGGVGSIYENNTFYGELNVSIRNWWQFPSQVNTARLYNNIYNSSKCITYLRDNTGAVNYTVEESNSCAQFQIPVSATTYANFSYSGVKNVRLTNNTLYIFNQLLQSPYDDVKINGVLNTSNIDNFTYSLATNDYVEVGNYGSTIITPIGSTTLSAGVNVVAGDSNTIYRINDSANSGIFRFSNSNTELDCNNTKIILDGKIPGYAIYIVKVNNITIKNCNIDTRAQIINSNQASNWTNNTNIWKFASTLATSNVNRLWIGGTEYPMASSNTTANTTHKWYFDTTNDLLYVYSTVNPASGGNLTHVVVAYGMWASDSSNIITNNINISAGYTHGTYLKNVSNSLFENSSFGSYGKKGIWVLRNDTSYSENIIFRNVTVDSMMRVSNAYNTIIDDAINLGIGTRNITIENSIIKDFGHSGIYLLGSTGSPSYDIYNNIIRNNYISGEGSSYFRCFNVDGLGKDVANNSFYNNTCYNTTVRSQINGYKNLFENNTINIVRGTDRYPTDNRGEGLSIDAYFTSADAHNNTIRGNVFSNTASACLMLAENVSGNVIEGNSFINCSQNPIKHIPSDIAIDPYDYKTYAYESYFINNTYGTGIISVRSKGANLTFMENDGIIFNFTTGGNKATLNFTGDKTVKLTNIADINILSLIEMLRASPYNDVYNVSTASVLSYDVDNYSLSLSSGQQIIIGNYGVDGNNTYTQNSNLNFSLWDFSITGIRWTEFGNVSGGATYYTYVINQTNVTLTNQLLYNCTYNVTINKTLAPLTITNNVNISNNYTLVLTINGAVTNFSTTESRNISTFSVGTYCMNPLLNLYDSKVRWYYNTTTGNNTYVNTIYDINITVS